jgi:soluble lytic murein transglycosylase-like protein
VFESVVLVKKINKMLVSALFVCAGTTGVYAEGFDMRAVPEPTGISASARHSFNSPAFNSPAFNSHVAAEQDDQPAINTNANVTAGQRDKPSRRDAKRAEQPGEGLRAMIAKHAHENGIPASLAEAIVRVESRFNPSARNGPYMGLMQIHPRTARGVGYQGAPAGLLDANTNLRYGTRYLAQAYRMTGGDTCRTVMKYQSGHMATSMNGANRAYCAKVRQYVALR